MGKWTTLLARLDADLLSGNWRTSSYTIPGSGAQRGFQNLQDFMSFYDWVSGKAESEAAVAAAGGSSTVAGRTYARPVRDT